ncbi:prion-like-(Q/N-rich) domain-bearing protein 25 [Teleopsis dalmanni]|uniref:prion-like-(Q/N-rich) domain-bearing protein 25 n=1 Tax=Teleopsis dalmanni TaxID=139649 RepID=UPI0018CD8EAB|nr:prion-like-(Q/N-rich) domain-bearing protein 25 [Teleopsis dalmanni]
MKMQNSYKLYFALVLLLGSLPDSKTVYWACETNDDCSADGATCLEESKSCSCDEFDSVFSSDFSKCLKTSLFGDTCEETIQCNLMPSGANCKSGVCDCADGLSYVRGRCRPVNGLGQYCDSDLDCYFAYDRESIKCENNNCACADGYYQRYGNICRRKSMEIDDACVVDTDCDELGPNIKCTNLMCQLPNDIEETSFESLKDETIKDDSQTSKNLKTEKYESEDTVKNGNSIFTDTETETESLSNNNKSREIAVQTSIENYELRLLNPQLKNVGTVTRSTSTSSKKQSYKRRNILFYKNDDEEKTLSTLSNTDDDIVGKKYGSLCTDNGKACDGLSHSICSNELCLCKLGYYPKNGRCIAELGEIAESSTECEHTFHDISRKCICQKNYFYERSLRACRKPIQYHLSCTSNSQCSPFGAAFCSSEIPRRCTCVEFASYDELRQMCLYNEGLGANCDTNDACPVENSECVNHYCVCKENFFEKNDACVAGIGAKCDTDENCVVENATCKDHETVSHRNEEGQKSCQCVKGYVHFKDECLKEVEEIEEPCVANEQCTPLLATCIDKKCSCTAEQHFKYGQCENRKGIGESCSRAGQCFIEKDSENVECRNSICQCKVGFQSDLEQKSCIRVLPNKKNSSSRPSALKIITFLLIGSAFLITCAAIKQAYY